jgi:hypothetical protein
MSGIPRVILAGGRAAPELAAEIKHSIRAMAVFQGRMLLDIVVEALLRADPTAPITVVGDVPDAPAYSRIADQGDFVHNVLAGVGANADVEWLLITSADLPFLTGPTITDFVRAALTLAATTQADLIYPIVPVSECYARYPGIKRTAIKLAEGEFTGGNMMLARPGFLLHNRGLLGRTYDARKNPLRLASMLGIETVARLALSQTLAPGFLKLALLEKRVGGLVGGTVAALACQHPEIATDLDRPSDFAAAAAYANEERPARR